MGNYVTVKNELENYIEARVPLIIINTCERERAEKMLREVSRDKRIEIGYYTDARQVTQFGSKAVKDVENDPLPYVAEKFRRNRRVTFALGDTRKIGEENMYSKELLNILYLALENASTLIIITPDIVWSRIAQFGMLTVLDYPDDEERRCQIERFVTTYGGRFPIEWEESDITRASALLRGFTEIQIENILSSTLVANGGLKKQHIYGLTKQKSRMYASVPCVEEVRIDPDMRVSGLENLKKWLKEKKKIFFMEEKLLRDRSMAPPKGILLSGIPGCGKSFSAKMIAQEWELPLFRFDIGSVYDKWVGESERKMREALSFIDNVAPCIVWIDEIEKALSVSDSGNDTGKRVLGHFLFWLQESSSRVFLVATANDILALPPELFRKGRFSELFFVGLPAREERQEVIAQYVRQCLHCCLETELLAELVDLSEGFSYSDIEYVIKEIAETALREGDEAVTPTYMKSVFRRVIPFARTNPDAVLKLREWGRRRAIAASYYEENEGGDHYE